MRFLISASVDSLRRRFLRIRAQRKAWKFDFVTLKNLNPDSLSLYKNGFCISLKNPKNSQGFLTKEI